MNLKVDEFQKIALGFGLRGTRPGIYLHHLIKSALQAMTPSNFKEGFFRDLSREEGNITCI